MPTLDGTYDTGTASVAIGSKIVTGQGTLWLTHLKSGDDFFGSIIDTVDSNTQFTLKCDWDRASRVTLPYVVRLSALSRNPAGVQAAEVTAIAAMLRTPGVIHPVPTGGAPDPDIGEDGNYAFSIADLLIWLKAGGVWTGPTSIGAVVNADYLVKTANPTLSAERAVTDNSAAGGAVWDWSVAGVVKAKFYASGANKVLYSTGANAWAESSWTTNGTNIENVGNITATGVAGIGVTGPFAFSKLQVRVAANQNLCVRQSFRLGATGVGFQMLNDAGNANCSLEFDADGAPLLFSGNPLHFYLNGVPVGIWNSTGFGVNTTSPTSKLTVVGGAQFRSAANPAAPAGKGVECYYDSALDVGYLFAFDRDVPAWKPLRLDGNTICLTGSTGSNVGIAQNAAVCTLDVNGPVRVKSYTVGTLPAASLGDGMRATVTDANAITLGTVVAGGGSHKAVVFSLNSAWYIGVGV